MNEGVLFISASNEDAGILRGMLEAVSIPLDHAVDLRQASFKIRRGRYQVILTEADLRDGNWMDVLSIVENLRAKPYVIVTHPFADAKFWAEVLSQGAYDLLVQPFYPTEVQRIVSNACQGAMHRQSASAVL
jgi:DNA-binding NtrC family response regulator